MKICYLSKLILMDIKNTKIYILVQIEAIVYSF